MKMGNCGIRTFRTFFVIVIIAKKKSIKKTPGCTPKTNVEDIFENLFLTIILLC